MRDGLPFQRFVDYDAVENARETGRDVDRAIHVGCVRVNVAARSIEGVKNITFDDAAFCKTIHEFPRIERFFWNRNVGMICQPACEPIFKIWISGFDPDHLIALAFVDGFGGEAGDRLDQHVQGGSWAGKFPRRANHRFGQGLGWPPSIFGGALIRVG